MKIPFFVPKEFLSMQEIFEGAYEGIEIFTCPDTPLTSLKPTELRVCRFCRKGNDVVTFNNRSHTIPEMLGNRYWINDYECDNCNSFFQKRESSLGNFLGISRTLVQLGGKKDIPYFDSPGNSFYAKKTHFFNAKQAVEIGQKNSKAPYFSKDGLQKEIKFSHRKPGYIPIHVYKAFLKIGLSVIPESEMQYYSESLRFLLSDSEQLSFRPAVIFLQMYPVGYGPDTPIVFLYKKKNPLAPYPTHYYKLCIKNYTFHFHFPLHINDFHFYIQKKEFSLPYCPPFFLNSIIEYNIPVSIVQKDLSSFEVKRDDIEIVTLTLLGNPSDRVAVDAKTMKIIDGAKQSEIVKLIISSDPNFSLKIQ